MNQQQDITSISASAGFPTELLRHDLEAVESAIRSQGRKFDPAVEPYVSYLLNSSGKRIRPALVFLAGGATGGNTPGHLKIAVTLELIHVATLVHDDIIDGAEIRRQAPTANAKWGSALSVLLGDCLFAHALELSTEFEDQSVGRKVARAANEVCTGEIIQTQRRFDFQLSRDDYFEIIRKKTAALFAAAAELGAQLNGESESIKGALRDYGSLIGTAYQVYDDCLDLVGDEKHAGKTLRTDLNKGKLTLPILNLIASASSRQREKLSRLLLQKEPVDLGALASIADYEGAIESAVDSGVSLVNRARESLLGLADNPHSRGLRGIADLLESLLNGCRQ